MDNDVKTGMIAGIAKGKALSTDVVNDENFEKSFEKVADWAEKVELEQTVGNAYTLICMGILRTVLGDELYDRPVDFDEEENADAAMEEVKRVLLDYIGVNETDYENAVPTEEEAAE